jgi:hypothetical protein
MHRLRTFGNKNVVVGAVIFVNSYTISLRFGSVGELWYFLNMEIGKERKVVANHEFTV